MPKQQRPRIVVRVETPRENVGKGAIIQALKAEGLSVLDAVVYYDRKQLAMPKPFDLFTAFKASGLTREAFVRDVKAAVQRKAS